ncbi:hypothetical protein SAMN05660359_04058 [Geodermatophilus obscurus]|uniref:Uncharacterized protein n=1 Tax=Geodermatophilus obscurus TaxID=1861 RepID=A0A1I5HWM8_9ACTN|nr:hypothetical protein SAMN05660359_04058 [Geodermatophilus obscurus]
MADSRDETPASQRADPVEPSPPPQPPWIERPGVKTFLGIGGFLAAVASVVIPLLLQSEDSASPTDTSFNSSAPTSSATPGATGTPEATGSAIASASVDVGDCLSPTNALLPCDGPHTAEVIGPESDCDTGTLVRYLGGVPEVDVLAPEAGIAIERVDDSPVCTARIGAGFVLTSHARDAWVGGRGDEWRWCIDDRSAQNVHCTQPHTAEVISEPPLQGESLDCRRRANEYTATDLSRYAFDITVAPRGPEGAQQCVIEVRTNSVLTASLRGLRSSALPIESA